jgi:hypothetical protein
MDRTEIIDEFKTNSIKTSNYLRIWQVISKPRETMRVITLNEKAIWIFPLLLLMASGLVFTLIMGSVKNRTSVFFDVPPDMEYYPEEFQDQYTNVMAQNNGFVRTTLFPLIGKWVGIWLNWLILSVILMVLLLLSGQQLEWRNVFNLVAWSSIPLIIRDLVQSIYLLLSNQLISSPGLSGFGMSEAQGFALFITIILGFIDLYLLWQMMLILKGYRAMVHTVLWKAFLILLVTFLLFLSLRSVPAFLMDKIIAVFSNGLFYF